MPGEPAPPQGFDGFIDRPVLTEVGSDEDISAGPRW
jgi:hypothetical protein